MGRRESDAYRRGKRQGPKNDSTKWLNNPARTDAELRDFTRGAADDLRQRSSRRQASNGSGTHKVKQHTRATPKGRKTRVKQHTRDNQGGAAQKPNTYSQRPRPSSSRNGSGTSRPTRRPSKKKKQQTPLVHPARAKRYLKRAFSLRTTNGRKAIGLAAAAFLTAAAYFLIQFIFFGVAAFAFIAALAGTLLEEVTKKG